MADRNDRFSNVRESRERAAESSNHHHPQSQGVGFILYLIRTMYCRAIPPIIMPSAFDLDANLQKGWHDVTRSTEL
jgi:hypothetical protein